MATYQRYTFSITLKGEDALESAVEVTAYFLDSEESQLLTLHAAETPNDAAEFSAVLDVALPQAISHAKYRVDGEQVASSAPTDATNDSNISQQELPGNIAAVKTTVAPRPESADAASDDDDSAIATPLSELQAPGPVAALKAQGQAESASSTCLDLSLSEIENVANQPAPPENVADQSTSVADTPVLESTADPKADIAEPAAPTANDPTLEKSLSDDDSGYVVVSKDDADKRPTDAADDTEAAASGSQAIGGDCANCTSTEEDSKPSAEASNDDPSDKNTTELVDDSANERKSATVTTDIPETEDSNVEAKAEEAKPGVSSLEKPAISTDDKPVATGEETEPAGSQTEELQAESADAGKEPEAEFKAEEAKADDVSKPKEPAANMAEPTESQAEEPEASAEESAVVTEELRQVESQAEMPKTEEPVAATEMPNTEAKAECEKTDVAEPDEPVIAAEELKAEDPEAEAPKPEEVKPEEPVSVAEEPKEEPKSEEPVAIVEEPVATTEKPAIASEDPKLPNSQAEESITENSTPEERNAEEPSEEVKAE
ncbi:hypothetical protein H4R22_004426, partial [Coemansia sp. RSA 1290]